MVPKVAGTGSSFKGAGLYYLHDKKSETRERVAFTHTENLPTLDPDKALKCMAYTALRQQELKARAGGSTKGRKLENPVYCYSLSWAPGEDPSQEEMITVAKESLAALGLAEHETLLVGHNDEPHPHIHVIVNRVHPETGIAAKLSKDFLTLSKWAEGYERSQGKIRCEQRVENNALRKQGEFVKDRHSKREAEYLRWRIERVSDVADKRVMEGKVIYDRFDAERDRLRQAKERDVDALRKRTAEANRTLWRDLFAIQKQERERLAAAQKNSFGRLRFFISTHRPDFRDRGKSARLELLKGAFTAFIGSKRQFERLDEKQKADRIKFGGKLNERAAPMVRRVEERHKPALEELRRRQGEELYELRMRQSRESQKEAREFKEGRDREQFEREKPDQSLSKKFTDAKDRRTSEKKSIDLSKEFRDAKRDVGRDVGGEKLKRIRENSNDLSRTRSRNRKPPEEE
jgi:hypothetical protein